MWHVRKERRRNTSWNKRRVGKYDVGKEINIREFWERTQVILATPDVTPSAVTLKSPKQHRTFCKVYHIEYENVAHLHLPPRHFMVGSKCMLWIATKLTHILKQGNCAISRYRGGTWQRTGYTRKGVHSYERT